MEGELDTDKSEINIPHAENSRSNNWHDPMYRGVSRPGKHEETNGDQDGSCDCWRETVLGLAATYLSSNLFPLLDQSNVVSVPKRIGSCRNHHTNQETEEGQANLRLRKSMVFSEHQGERSEEEVQDAEQDCREETKVGAHWLQKQELEWTEQGVTDSLGNRLVRFLKRGSPPLFSRLFSELLSFLS